jgi:RNA polymerase sigma-70 factor (ECF subfamily)
MLKKPMNDNQAVEAAKADHGKFADLYDKYVDQIYRYIYRRVGDAEMVQDLVSQTFFDALSHLDSYQDRGFPFSSWLYKIAHNNVLKWYRQKSRYNKVDLDEIAELKGDQNVEEEIDLKKEKGGVTAALEELEYEHREIIRLKYFEGVSNIEIAQIMGISANNVGVKLYRALKKLKQLINND